MRDEERLGWWEARRLRRSSGADLAILGLGVVLAGLVLVTGRRAHSQLTPRSAIAQAKRLDQLERPTRLPDAMVTDAAGQRAPIFQRMKKPRAAVAFYAPWCGPCQKEVPALARMLGSNVDILVVASPDEDVDETRRQLANLGLEGVQLVFDDTRQLEREGRVTALPTTFIVTRQGLVLARTMGYSMGELAILRQRLALGGADVLEAE